MCDLDGGRVQDTAHRWTLALEFYSLRAMLAEGTVSSRAIRSVGSSAVLPLVHGGGKSAGDEFADELPAGRQIKADYRAQ